MRHLKRYGWLMAISLLGLLTTGCGEGGHESAGHAARPAVAAETRVAAMQPIGLVTEATGSVEPWVRVSPGTKILGRIDQFLVREGDRVRSGQVLVRLEKRDLEAAVAQARAATAMAEANLDNARAQYERMQALHDRGSATAKNLEDATTGFHVAEASVAQARANLAASEVMLGYAEIRSPVPGWVVAKMAEAGDMAAPGTPLLTLEDLSRVKVVVQVPESDVVGLSEGDPARVRIDVLDEIEDAVVDRIVPAGDPASRTYRVQLVLDNLDGRIKSGMFARATFERGDREALLVPSRAVLDRGQLRGLYVVDDQGLARLRWVRLGRDFDSAVEVLSGLAPGERYVVDPPPVMTDGSPVESR
jgi:RND family efflux transporter MFP subunit